MNDCFLLKLGENTVSNVCLTALQIVTSMDMITSIIMQLIVSSHANCVIASLLLKMAIVSSHANCVIASLFKVKNDHRSKFSNLSNWKEEA